MREPHVGAAARVGLGSCWVFSWLCVQMAVPVPGCLWARVQISVNFFVSLSSCSRRMEPRCSHAWPSLPAHAPTHTTHRPTSTPPPPPPPPLSLSFYASFLSKTAASSRINPLLHLTAPTPAAGAAAATPATSPSATPAPSSPVRGTGVEKGRAPGPANAIGSGGPGPEAIGPAVTGPGVGQGGQQRHRKDRAG